MKIFKLPDLGEGLQDAEIVEWHVKAGDEIAADRGTRRLRRLRVRRLILTD
jgi:hypothetical protein